MANKYFYILILLSLFSLSSYADKEKFFIQTSSGSIQGYVKNKVVNFDDIPYAIPPVGLLRWKAPRELKAKNITIYKKMVITAFKSPHQWEEPLVQIF
jgi:carboxylesterase type B